MKNKKECRKRNASTSSSCSSSSSVSNSDRNRSKPSDKKQRHKVDKHGKNKHSSKRTRSPSRDLKSKWDSPDDRAEKRRPGERGEKRHSTEQSDSSRHRQTEHRTGRSKDHRSRDDTREKEGTQDTTAKGDLKPNTEHSHEYDRHKQSETSQGRSRYRKDHNSSHRRNAHESNRNRSPHRSNDRRRRRTRSKSFDHSNAVWGKAGNNEKRPLEAPKEKEKPNFGLSGKLTEETNTYKGVVIKYSEPPEARKPKRRWRLYPFKGEKAMQTLYIHRESAYLIGRDRKVVDLPVDHPSCSKQHAALQYRLVPFTRENGSAGKRVRPYLIDLESANGTYINNKKIEAKKYIELLERDVIKFGFSSREYVFLHENSKDENQDDDVNDEVSTAVPAEAATATETAEET